MFGVFYKYVEYEKYTEPIYKCHFMDIFFNSMYFAKNVWLFASDIKCQINKQDNLGEGREATKSINWLPLFQGSRGASKR